MTFPLALEMSLVLISKIAIRAKLRLMKMVDIIAKTIVSNKNGNYHGRHQDFFPVSAVMGAQHMRGFIK